MEGDWTETPPDEPGWYWIRWERASGGTARKVVQVGLNSRNFLDALGVPDEAVEWWPIPLTPPEPPE